MGRLTSTLSEDAVLTQYEYNSWGGISRESATLGPDSFAVDFGYDDFGRLATVTYPSVAGNDPLVAAFSYDVLSNAANQHIRPASVEQVSKLLSRDGTDRPDPPQSVVEGNILTERTFVPWLGSEQDRKTYLTDSPTTLLEEVQYSWAGNGQLDERNDISDGRVESFGHDEHGRIVDWNVVSGALTESHAYEYDVIGNMTNFDGQIRTFSDATHPNQIVQADGDTTFSYDSAGNLVGGSGLTASYSSNRLVKTLTRSGQTTSNDYDALGNRVRSSSTAENTTYLSGLYARRDQGTLIEHSMFVPGVGVVKLLEQGGSITQESVHYVTEDHLGSTSLVFDAAGQVVERQLYSPYGRPMNASGAIETTVPASTVSHGFAGHRLEEQTGTVHMGARAYDPSLATMLAPDPVLGSPLATESMNPYSYVWKQPVAVR